eukprot:CAMPEP_0174735660 /NCGR_PEP_ID=MMETSP1094-20130205/65343_1 /TAXON_ID=156173 /ORGANISM="Chrysochromulina brevifilum, Strain UTEX LB 985" /LENGTH=111 /DNA_ID=CAMNT_0015938651 /DNA_START=117 /DNA_END=449 /DNA_ORIENTATION=+
MTQSLFDFCADPDPAILSRRSTSSDDANSAICSANLSGVSFITVTWKCRPKPMNTVSHNAPRRGLDHSSVYPTMRRTAIIFSNMKPVASSQVTANGTPAVDRRPFNQGVHP